MEGSLLTNGISTTNSARRVSTFKIQGGFALEVNWSIDRTTIANVSHLPFENIRSGFVNEDEKVEYYYYSKDWNDKREEPSEICTFNPERNIEHPTQILYVKPFSPGSFYYPKPDYVGSINYIELDKEIGVYHINNMKNGMSPSFSIHFKNGIPPQEERNRIRMDIERQLSGASNAGKFIVTYSDDPDRKPDFEPFQLSDAHNQYQFLSEEVTSKIMVGHRVTSPQMFGVAVPGKLGGGGELAEASELFEKNVIAPARQVVTEAVKTLLNAAGLDAQLVQLSEEPQEVNLDGCVDYLTDKGEEMSDEWELIDESPVDYDLEKARDAMWAFARAILPDRKPSNRRQERTRYRDYQGSLCLRSRSSVTQADSPATSVKRWSTAGRVYRKEDIEAASLKSGEPRTRCKWREYLRPLFVQRRSELPPFLAVKTYVSAKETTRKSRSTKRRNSSEKQESMRSDYPRTISELHNVPSICRMKAS